MSDTDPQNLKNAATTQDERRLAEELVTNTSRAGATHRLILVELVDPRETWRVEVLRTGSA